MRDLKSDQKRDADARRDLQCDNVYHQGSAAALDNLPVNGVMTVNNRALTGLADNTVCE